MVTVVHFIFMSRRKWLTFMLNDLIGTLGNYDIFYMQVLKESGIQALPIAYQNTNIPNDDNILDMIIGLCLTDSNFPAFVNRVEQRIKDITSEAVQPAHTSDASDTSTL